MIKALLVFALLAAAVLSAPQLLRNGVFELVHLKDAQYAEFEVYVRGGHRGIFIQASPYGCDGPVMLYGGKKANPTKEDHEWSSEFEAVARPTFMFIEDHEHANATLYINAISHGAGSHCVIHIVAHIEHIQTLLTLSEGVPAYGVYRPKKRDAEQHNHWFAYKLKKDDKIKFEDISFLTTNLEGRRGRGDVVLNSYASVTNSRPLPEKHDWAGLTTTHGDSFLSINSKDPQFKKDGSYFVNAHLQSPQEVRGEEMIFYSIVAHTLTKTTNVTTDPAVLLFDTQVQSGFAPANHFAFFTTYVDKARVGKDVHVIVRNTFGAVQTWGSSKTSRPNQKNHEWQGKQVSNENVMTINVKEPSFVYIGVWADPNVELLSTFDVRYHRN